MLQNVGEKVGVAVISAVILGLLALLWNFASQGGLVEALGGVPKGRLAEMIREVAEKDATLRGPKGEPGPSGAEGPAGPKGEQGSPGNAAGLPKGLVAAFDTVDQCPDGWSPFRAGQSRMIVGASFGIGPEPGMGRDGEGQQIREFKYREHGGSEMVVLKEPQMPKHSHSLYRVADVNAPGIEGLLVRGPGSVRVDSGAVGESGGSEAHNNMPPYVALYFCKKD